jgi:hypothetical protein
MSAPQTMVRVVRAIFTADGSEIMEELGSGRDFASAGIDAGGYIDIGDTTSFSLTITDTHGKVLYTGTGISADTQVDATANGVQGALIATLSSLSGTGTVTIIWYIRA